MKKLILSLFLIVVFSGCVQQNKPMACTEGAIICPDGTAVGKVPPNCEFAPCPSTCVCPEGYIAEGNACNPKCYYSTPKCLMPSIHCMNCSSFSVEDCPAECELCGDSVVSSYEKCHTVEFCKQIHGSICSDFSVDKCPNQCVVCPPCIECSSISCQTEGFCKSIGFDRNWYNRTLIHTGSLPD